MTYLAAPRIPNFPNDTDLFVLILARLADLYRVSGWHRVGESLQYFVAPFEMGGVTYTFQVDRDSRHGTTILYRIVVDDEGDEVEQEVAVVGADDSAQLARALLQAIKEDLTLTVDSV